MNRAAPTPVRLRVHDTTLATNVLRCVGYRAVCACGWRGSTREKYDEARQDARQHNDDHRKESPSLIT